MKKVLIAPRKYVQGRGVLDEIGAYAKLLGQRPLALWDSRVKAVIGERALASLRQAGLSPVEEVFRGEATKEEAARVVQAAKVAGADAIVGAGGGKALDVAKAVAHELHCGLMTVPTLASTDAPTSSFTVWYDQDGNFINFVGWSFNPDVVLVDTQVIVNAPVRGFVAGMGDALSTWVEAEASAKTHGVTLAGGGPTMAALALAKLCFDTLMEHGCQARRDVELHLVTPAVEKVVEANVLLSGLGFESGGLATAHMIANSLPAFKECKGFMHGEKVGFGVASQLCLDEDLTEAKAAEIIDWEIDVGLPVTLADLNLAGVTRERLMSIGKICAGEGSLCHNHAFPVTADAVVDAMIAADALGRERKALKRG